MEVRRRRKPPGPPAGMCETEILRVRVQALEEWRVGACPGCMLEVRAQEQSRLLAHRNSRATVRCEIGEAARMTSKWMTRCWVDVRTEHSVASKLVATVHEGRIFATRRCSRSAKYATVDDLV